MGKSNPPRPPDPMKTASAQTSTNIGSAIANNQMGMVDQITPDGTLSYSQSGTYNYTDPVSGKVYALPKTTATTKLSGMGQQIKDQNDQTQLNMAQTGNQQSAFLQDYLGTPWNPDTNEIEGRLMELGTARLDPRFAQEEDRLRTRLENQGVTAGSEAWNREMSSFGQNKNDAFNQLMLQGRGQAMGELAAIRNQPLNEISSLMGGSQIVAPNFGIFQPQGAATTDVAGLINNNYNQRMGNWQQQNAQQQSLLGGMFGLGASAITGGLF